MSTRRRQSARSASATDLPSSTAVIRVEGVESERVINAVRPGPPKSTGKLSWRNATAVGSITELPGWRLPCPIERADRPAHLGRTHGQSQRTKTTENRSRSLKY